MSETREIEIKLNSTSAESSANRLNSKVKSIGVSTDNTTTSLSNMTKVATAVGTALATAQVQRYADAWTNANNRINAATATQEEFIIAQQGVISIAQEAGIELSSVADGYSRLAQNTSELGLSQERVLDITKKVTLAIKAGGATAQEAASIIVQLGQGLGSGALQGDELKSIMEASIPITKALASEFGVTTGALKQLGADGLITADRVVSALEQMDERSLTFTKDISSGFTEVSNALTVYIGGLDESLGATENVTGALSFLAENIQEVVEGATVLAVIIGARYVGALTSATASQALLAAASLKSTTQMNALGVVTGRTTLAMNIGATAARGLSSAMAFIGGPVGVAVIAAAALYSFTQRSDETERSAAETTLKINELSKSFEGLSENVRKTNFQQNQKDMVELSKELISLTKVVSSFDELSGDPLAYIDVEEAKARIAEIKIELQSLKDSQAALFPKIDESGFTQNIKDGEEVSPNTKNPDDTSDDDDSYNALLERLRLETEAIQAEEETRRAFNEGLINQRQLDEDLALQQIYFNYEARRMAILENEKITDEQRKELLAELALQEIEAEKLKQEELTAAAESGANDRIQVSSQESSQVKSMLISTAVSAFNLTQNSNKEMTKEQKKQAKQSILIQTAAAIARAYGENNFYVATGMAVFLAAMQLRQLNSVSSASSSSSSVSTSSTATSALTTPTVDNQTTQKTINFVGLENFGPDDFIPMTKAQFVDYMSQDEDVNVAVNSGQISAARIGAI